MSKLAKIFHILIIICMLIPFGAQDALAASLLQEDSTGIYRTHITLPFATSRTKLDSLGVLVLSEGSGSAVILASSEQLKTFARLGFKPQGSDEVRNLVEAHTKDNPWLEQSVQTWMGEAASIWSMQAESGGTIENNQAAAADPLRALLPTLTTEQIASIGGVTSVDTDGDGLTDTEEAWWCTDPNNPNTDVDAQGYTDGQEVTAVLDFTLPRSERWGYGAPFGPPAAWPDFNGMDGDPETPACNDGDYDTIPDFAEVYMVGSNVPAESTDRDKFDDGQELFGVTYCPGAPVSCGYGNYPRIEYWNFIQAQMPTWVLPPGDNIFVAAFPVPEVSVVPGSWTVNRVTVITTEEGQMTETTNSYETSVMQGQSTSIADTVTWNNWEEVSEAVETPSGLNLHATLESQGLWDKSWAYLKVMGGLGTFAGGCLVGTVIAGPVGTAIGCMAGAISGAISIKEGIEEWYSDEIQQEIQTNRYPENGQPWNGVGSGGGGGSWGSNYDDQGLGSVSDNFAYAINQQGELLARGLYDIGYQLTRPRLTETHTNGSSWGGSQTVTNEVYEEHTITEGQAFTSGQNWSTAWAVDSSHAADLTFNFTVQNSGTEYAREITGLIFNVYLGDDTNPIVSYPAWEQFANGKLENVFPGDTQTFASTNIPLTLEQMRRIDLGESLVVVLEDYSYGADELFYQDAVNGGVTFFIEDGVEDDDETVDSYVIPTWGNEHVQDVLTRYFPAGVDADGSLNSLWTPEFDGINPPIWNEYFLSDIAWWNLYLTQADAGDTPLQDLPAQAGSALLFRFNRDSDRDGYQDRVEMMHYCSLSPLDPDYLYCGTAQDQATIHPQPEVLAGYTSSRNGDDVTVLLKVANLGNFDAYGIDAVMYAPDDTVTIGNNTIGGNGRRDLDSRWQWVAWC